MNFERKKNGIDMRALSNYNFKVKLDQEECFQCLQLAHRKEAPSHVTIFTGGSQNFVEVEVLSWMKNSWEDRCQL